LKPATDEHGFAQIKSANQTEEKTRMHKTTSAQLSFSNLCKSMFIWGSLLLVLSTSGAALAQHGGKAEPKRIEFQRGSKTITISDTVRGSEEAEYVLAAKKGQRLIIKLTSVPAKSSVFQLLGEDNDTLGLEHDANFDYSGVLPKTGDYFINVSRPTESRGTSRYKLTITIR
jgi:hypothetical protein